MVTFGFYALPFLAILMLLLVLRNAESKTLYFKYVGFIILWLFYIAILNGMDLLKDFSLPPRIPLMIVMPILVFMIAIIQTKPFNSIVTKTPLQLPIYLQSFRIVVELLIYGAFLESILPQQATFEGYNYDILIGLSAPITGSLIQRGKLGKKGILLWNIAGLIILIATVSAFIHTYYFTDFIEKSGSTGFVEFPYLFLASVLLPVALFLHFLSLKQVI